MTKIAKAAAKVAAPKTAAAKPSRPAKTTKVAKTAQAPKKAKAPVSRHVVALRAWRTIATKKLAGVKDRAARIAIKAQIASYDAALA